VIDVERLTGWMDDQGLPGGGESTEISQISGGSQNLIYEVRRGDFHVVLRTPPTHAPASRDDGIRREWRILQALDGTDVPHTPPVAACDDHRVLGRPFYLMRFVDGWSPKVSMGKVQAPSWPDPFEKDLDQRRGLAYQLIEGLAALDRVDWQHKGLSELGRPVGFHERQVNRWTAYFERIQVRPLPGFEESAAWLRTRRPIDYVPGLMHGDYQFANVMFCHGCPARLAAIVDWEMGTVGDPKLDLGWALQTWPEDTLAPTAASRIIDLYGMPSKDELLAHYSYLTGRQVYDIDYYIVLARWKYAIVLEHGYQRANGDLKLEGFGPAVLELMKEAADLAETTDYAP
jgi:aminoglycoside phosphotransferase (APT) family kinase protein